MSGLCVLHVSTARIWRGGEQQVAYLFEGLQDMGVQQWLLCRKGSALHQYAADRHWPVLPYSLRAGIDPFFARHIQQQAAKYEAQVIHLHDGHAVTAGWLAARLWGCRALQVISRRVMFPLSGGWLSRQKYTHNHVGAILCVSEAVKRQVVADTKGKVPAYVVHDGIAASPPTEDNRNRLRQLVGVDDSQVLVGHVAALTSEKGWDTFLEAGRLLVNSDKRIHLVAIGAGPLQSALQQQATALGLAGRITFTGFIPNIAPLLAGLDVLLFPSTSEGLGSVLLDAMAAGVPVVASDTGGIPDIIHNGENGLLVAPHQPQLFAEQVQHILSDDAQRQRFIAAGQETVSRYSVAAMVDETTSLYRQVIGDMQQAVM